MQKSLIKKLNSTFEGAKHEKDGIEFWYARELQELLGYTEWRKFKGVIEKAKTACQTSGNEVLDHFVGAAKMVDVGSGATREIEDIILSRYACYLIAQNGDPRKNEIAFAQTYFAVQTRKQEVLEQRIAEFERLRERHELTEAEKILSALIYERGIDKEGFARIRSEGDKAFFGYTTGQMKTKLNVPENRPLADFLHEIAITGKKLATQITNYNIEDKDLQGEPSITKEHIESNTAIRKALKDRGIKPENLPPGEDTKKVERRVEAEKKKLPKTTKKLKKEQP